jgi:glycosyltransferase involved in cell wall biosynthesis
VRILLDYRPALRERTGVGHYVHEAAQALARSAAPDEHLTLFSSSWKDRVPAGVVSGADVVDRRVPVRVLNWLWHRTGWPNVEQLAAGRFDVVQTAHPLLAPSSGAARLVTIHDLDFLDHPERTRAEIRRDYPELAASHARRADQVVAVSAFTADEVERRLGVPRDRISICSPGAPDWPRRTAEPADGYILFLGTLEPRKNVGALLDAYERLLARRPDAPALVLAGGQPADAAPLLARAAAAPFAGRVRLPGYVAPGDRLGLYRGALAFVLPSHLEGFGMPVVEAMTVGVPVIAADRGALPEVAGGAARLVDPDDPEAVAAALDAVLANPPLRRAMIEQGWTAAGRYTWSRTAAALREAWARALAHRSHG